MATLASLNSSNLQPGFEFNKVPSNSALNTFMTADFINTSEGFEGVGKRDNPRIWGEADQITLVCHGD